MKRTLNRPVSRNADTFGYNDRSEVTLANISGFSNAYDYDEIGNLLLSAQNIVTQLYTANNLNQYTSILRDSVSPWEPSYDTDGNLLSDGVFTFTYDAANRLKTVSTNGILVLTNFYDAKSRRVRKVTPDAATTFFYDDWNLIEERIAYTNGTASAIHYYWGKDLSGTLQGAGGVGGLLYLTVNDSVYIPFYDNNGNITRYLDATGNTVAQYTYDAFGNTISQSGSLANIFRHRFSTKYIDSETGLYYYGYRFYHPILMRWLNRDTIEEEGGVNLYAICANALIINFDILGRDNGTVIVEGLGSGWAGARVTLNGKTAVKLNNELYYLTMTKPIGTRNPLSGSSTSLFLFKDGNPKRALRIDYHKFPLNSPDPPYWHINVDGGGIARVANSSKLNHTTSAKIRGTGRVLTVFKNGDKICFVAGVAMSAIDIYKAENRVRESVRQVGGWGGAYAGGRIGQQLVREQV